MKKNVLDRQKVERKNKWHVRRGTHEIFYTDLEDLLYIINKERPEFEKYDWNIELWNVKIKHVIKLSRNIVDHHNPLPTREVKRLERALEDWERQFKGASV